MKRRKIEETTLDCLMDMIETESDLKEATLSCLDVMLILNYGETLDMVGFHGAAELTKALNDFMQRVHSIIKPNDQNKPGGVEAWIENLK